MFLKELEHFLSLDGASGFERKQKDFIDLFGATEKERGNQWFSVCAELGAMFIIGAELKLQIDGFEQRALRNGGQKTCDFRVRIGNESLFLECRAKAGERRQNLPPQIEKLLCTVPLRADVQSYKKKWMDQEIDQELKSLQAHLGVGRTGNGPQPAGPPPAPYCSKLLHVEFLPGSNSQSEIALQFDPDGVDEIRSWLFGSGTGSQKEPMIKQARQKGANYLICLVPTRDDNLVPSCFAPLARTAERTYSSCHPEMQSLRGVILYNEMRDFWVVNSAASVGQAQIRI